MEHQAALDERDRTVAELKQRLEDAGRASQETRSLRDEVDRLRCAVVAAVDIYLLSPFCLSFCWVCFHLCQSHTLWFNLRSSHIEYSERAGEAAKLEGQLEKLRRRVDAQSDLSAQVRTERCYRVAACGRLM
jgi:hypothetical protein